MRLREVLTGPWRAVAALGITQIIAWGAMFYTPVLMVPLIAAERGFSFTFGMGGFSAGLLVAGLLSPLVGRLIDRHGGHRVMPFGSLAGAAGLVGLTFASHPLAYALVWLLLGAAISASLYDPAFATLGRIFGARARSPITALTLAGGFASTVSWPVTYALLGPLGWKGTYLVYAAALALVAAPLHAFALPRLRASAEPAAQGSAPAQPPHIAAGPVFVLLVTAFSTCAFIPSGMSAHLLGVLQRSGMEPGTAVLIGSLFGPAQVAARLCELIFARNLHPLQIARLAAALIVLAFGMLALLGLSVPTGFAFAVMFGAANGLITITRGAVPLALFGSAGYGHTIGRIARSALIVTALAPVMFALVAEQVSDAAALGLAAACAVVALVCFMLIRR